jgi:hypothetical protein
MLKKILSVLINNKVESKSENLDSSSQPLFIEDYLQI